MKSSTAPARYWSREDDGRVRCELCPHRCLLKDGQRGRCSLRIAIEGELRLSAWGKCSGLALDPIEKKPLYHFLPSSSVLSFGTIGCNLSCAFCQNWDISVERDLRRLRIQTTAEDIARTALKEGAASVAFTYNEPIISIEWVMEVARACHEMGIRTVAVTAGEILPEPRRDFFSVIDAANVDLKSFSDDFYRRVCGARLQPVLDNLVLMKEQGVWVEVTTLVIPGLNDSSEELRNIAEFILHDLGAETPWHVSAFYPTYKLLDRPRTPAATLDRARQIGLEAGLRYVYEGNVWGSEGENTYCYNCGECVIRRQGYTIVDSRIEEGKCSLCGARIDGVGM